MNLRNRAIAAGLSATLAFGTCAPIALASPQDDLAAAAQRLDELGGELATFQDRLAEQSASLEDTSYRIGEKQAQMEQTELWPTAGVEQIFAWDPDDFMYLVDQPLLMVVGEKADTAYMSQSAFDAAMGTQDKELYVVSGATHVDLYWRPGMVDDALAKLAEFFGSRL